MATSSPYTQNDYQVFNARPYNLPSNEIAKAFIAKNEYWKIGAEAVKSRFDDILNLDLSKEENRQIRDQFIEKSQKDLQQLNGKDLSDPNIKRAGMQLFDPILKDPGILYDDQATKHYKKVISDSEKYRTEDGGKYYNQDNVAYALDGWDNFLASPDRMAGKQYLQKAKEYIPYYDFHSEIPAIMKECKPNSASSDALGVMYINHTSIESRSAQQVTGCLDAGLSPRAKQQINIHGYATYKNNPEALRDSYLPLVSGQSQNLSIENARLNAILANKDKLGKMSVDELKKMGLNKNMINPEYISSLEAQRDDNDLRLDNLNKTAHSLSTGDLSPIMGDHFENIAGAVYSRDYLNNYGRGFEYTKTDQGKKGDNVQLQIMHENREDNRLDDKQDFDLRMQKDDQGFQLGLEKMKMDERMQEKMFEASLKAGRLTGAGLTQQDLNDARHFNPAFEGDVENASYEKIVQRRSQIVAERGDLSQRLQSQLGNLPGFPKGKSWSDPVTQEWYKAYTKTLPKDDPMWKVISPFEQRMSSLVSEEQMLKNNQEDIDKEVYKHVENPSAPILNSLIADRTPVYGNKTKADILQDLQNGRAKLNIDTAPLGRISFQYTGKDGKVHTFDQSKVDMDGKLKKQFEDISSYLNSTHQYYQNIIKKRNELAKDMTTIQTEGYTFPELNDPKSPFKLRVAQNLGIGEKDLDKLIIGDTDLKGNAIITINPHSKDGSFQKNAIEKLQRTYGIGNIKPVQGSDNSFIVGGFEGFNIIDKNRISSVYNPIIRGLEKRVGLNNPKNTGLIRAKDPRYLYGLEVQPGLAPESYTYRLYNEKNQTKDIYHDRKEALRNLELYLNPNTQ